MKKGVLLIVLLIGAVYYFGFNGHDENYESHDSGQLEEPSLEISVHNKITKHQVKILKKALKKETVNSKAFQKFVDPNQKKPVEDKAFLKDTFETLLDCYQEGCGEQADHQGYYNEAQTVAATTINKILEENLKKNSSPEWMQESDLLELFSSANKRTRKLAFDHLMKRGDKALQVTKILDEANKLDGYKIGDTVRHLVSNIDEQTRQAFIDTIEESFQNQNNDGLGRDETGRALIEFNVSENEWKQLWTHRCNDLKDEDIGKSTIYAANTQSKNSNLSISLESFCKSQ